MMQPSQRHIPGRPGSCGSTAGPGAGPGPPRRPGHPQQHRRLDGTIRRQPWARGCAGSRRPKRLRARPADRESGGRTVPIPPLTCPKVTVNRLALRYLAAYLPRPSSQGAVYSVTDYDMRPRPHRCPPGTHVPFGRSAKAERPRRPGLDQLSLGYESTGSSAQTRLVFGVQRVRCSLHRGVCPRLKSRRLSTASVLHAPLHCSRHPHRPADRDADPAHPDLPLGTPTTRSAHPAAASQPGP
jgi:hypothetical protein